MRCRELGNPLGNELSNLFAGNNLAFIGGPDAALDRRQSFGVHRYFFGANQRISVSGFSHTPTVARIGPLCKPYR